MLYPPVADLLKDVESRYLLVNVVAHRARQIAAEAEEFNEELPEKAGENMPLYRSYKYGKVKITVYRWNDDENSDMSGQL